MQKVHEMIIDIAQNFVSFSCRFCNAYHQDFNDLIEHEERCLSTQHVLNGTNPVAKKCYAPCILHDQNEKGQIEKCFYNMFNLNQEEQDHLNNRIQLVSKSFKNHISLSSFRVKMDRNDKKFHLKGTGIQKYHFLKFFPIINQSIPNNSDKFEVYFLLNAVVDFCNSEVIYKSDLGFLDRLVAKFITKFKETYPNETITYKIHIMVHYSKLILEFGTLLFSSTLRFERVHQKGNFFRIRAPHTGKFSPIIR